MKAEDFIDIVRNRVDEMEVSLYYITRVHGLQRDSVRNVLRGKVPNLDRTIAISEALDLEVYIGPPRPPGAPPAPRSTMADMIELINKIMRVRRENRRAAAMSRGLSPDALRNFLEGHAPALHRAITLAEGFGLEFYIGPPRPPAEGEELVPPLDPTRAVITTEKEFRRVIRERLEELGGKVHGTAVAAGLPKDAFRSVLGGHPPSFPRIAEICEALDLEFYIGPVRPYLAPPPGPLPPRGPGGSPLLPKNLKAQSSKSGGSRPRGRPKGSKNRT